MRSSVLGLFAGLLIVVYSVIHTNDEVFTFLNGISILIVFGGTISAAIITHGVGQIKDIFFMFFKAFKTSKYDEVRTIKEAIEISKKVSQGYSAHDLANGDYHPYVKDGLRLIENQFSKERIISISKRMLQERANHYKTSIDQLDVLGKYPPAFGMMGTIIGLIAVMKKMGVDTGIENVGPNMAVALITTLYGIFLANYVIHPISDNLAARSEKDLKIRRIIAEAIVLIQQKEDPIYVREMLVAYLLPAQRAELLAELNTTRINKRAA